MAYTLFSHYSTGIFPRPADDIDPKNKNEAWHMAWCQYILGYGSRESNLTPYSRQDYIRMLRSYAEGSQDPDQYYKRFYDESSLDSIPNSQTDYDNDSSYQSRRNRREAFMNVNWQILPVFPKYLQLLLGKFSSMEHDITAEAIDLKSGEERENQKWDTWFETSQREFLEQFYASIGSEPQTSISFTPNNIEELELFDSMGGFKLKHEIAIEEIIEHSFNISNWSETVKRKMIEDLINVGICACKDYLDVRTKTVKTLYLDIERLIIPYKTEDEYDNPEFWGYMRLYRAAELRLRGIPEEQIRAYSKNVANHFGNNSWDEVERYQQKNPHLRAYDDFHIPVMECEWDSVDTYYDQTRINSKGEQVIKEEFYDVGAKKFDNKIYQSRNKRSINRTDVKVKYKCNWIVDSNHIFGYGKVYDTQRTDGEVKSSVHAYRLAGKSILERCIVNLDNIQINWLKLQNAIAIAAPPGIAIEYDALTNISTGNGRDTFHPLDILRIRSQQGHILYKLTTMGTGTMLEGRGNAGRPIQELQGGFGAALNDALQAFQMDINMIQQNTGISSVADASNPDPTQPVAGSEMAIVATNNALRMIYNGYIGIKQSVAEVMAYKIQLLIQNDRSVYEKYFPIIGRTKLKTLSIADEMAASDYGIKIEARPTEEMKADIKEQIKIAMASGKNGIPLLKSSQGMMLMGMIESGTPLKLISSFLSYYENKEAENQEKIRQANIQEQGEQKRQSDAEAAQMKLEEMQRKLQGEIQLEQIKGEEDRKTEDVKHRNKMEEIVATEEIRLSAQQNVPESI